MKAFQETFNQYIVKPAATVCVKDLDFKQVPLHRGKGIMDQLDGFVCPCAVPDDLSGPQIQQDADIRPLRPDPDVCQVTDDTVPGSLSLNFRSRRFATGASFTLDA